MDDERAGDDMGNAVAAGDWVLGRFRFWRDGFWRVGLTNVVLSVTVAGLVADRIYTAHHPPEPLYFFTDGHGNLIRGTPLNRPVMSDADLMDFAAKSVLAAYNFDYVHYRETLARDAAPNFTINGWNGLVAAVEATKNLEEIKARAMVVSAVPLAGPSLKKWATVGDHLIWKIQLPIRVTYANTNGSRDMDLVVTATVVRVPTAFHPRGVAIDAFVAEPPR